MIAIIFTRCFPMFLLVYIISSQIHIVVCLWFSCRWLPFRFLFLLFHAMNLSPILICFSFFICLSSSALWIYSLFLFFQFVLWLLLFDLFFIINFFFFRHFVFFFYFFVYSICCFAVVFSNFHSTLERPFDDSEIHL